MIRAGESEQLRTDSRNESGNPSCSTIDSFQPGTTLVLVGLLSLAALATNCDMAVAAGDASASHPHWAPALGAPLMPAHYISVD